MGYISKINIGGSDYDIKDEQLAEEVSKKVDSTSLAAVATSGSYNDLKDLPVIPEIDTSALATKEEVRNLTDEIIANEEVTAAALNDLEEKKADKEYVEQYVEDAITSAITTALNTEV